MNVMWDWLPNIRLGPVVLGENIDIYINSLNVYLEDEEQDDMTDWVRYVVPDVDIYIDVENGKVVSVTSYGEFIYKGKNIIGMNVIDLDRILGCAADEVGGSVVYDDGDRRTPYEYFNLGLQVWTSKNIITSGSCLTYEDCDNN
jgi:hypothetical protein